MIKKLIAILFSLTVVISCSKTTTDNKSNSADAKPSPPGSTTPPCAESPGDATFTDSTGKHWAPGGQNCTASSPSVCYQDFCEVVGCGIGRASQCVTCNESVINVGKLGISVDPLNSSQCRKK